MKKNYKTPKATRVDFAYDEQVVAQSEVFEGRRGTPHEGFLECQYGGGTCEYFYTTELACDVIDIPWSLRRPGV